MRKEPITEDYPLGHGPSEEQALAIRCAYADLLGALEAHEQGDSHLHDWKAHALSIQELGNAFPNILEDRISL
jgi:hypothetical protein